MNYENPFSLSANSGNVTDMKTTFAHWRASFLAGLAVILPAAVSIGVVIWLFGTISNFTDTLLLFLPKEWTHERNGAGPMSLQWSLIAFLLAIVLITLVGRFARHYLGKQLIQLVDVALMRVPLFNKIYGVFKQIKEAFTSSKAATFKQVVLVEFPRPGLYSLGFITGSQNGEMQFKTGQSLLSVFVPTPPLTSGSVVLLPEVDVIKLNISVADGIKFIMSLGSASPACLPQDTGRRAHVPEDPLESGVVATPGELGGDRRLPALAP
jgi:uncharacterized membrane protein